MRSYLLVTFLLVLISFSACKDDSQAPGIMIEKEETFIKDFDVTCSNIPIDQIQEGGPPKDGIPAIDEPQYVSVSQATFLNDSDMVMGLVRGQRARAYPTRILDWHEIVNDSINNEDLLITYCPLCGSGMAFKGEWGGEKRSFGVSGLLYNSDVLLYDRKTESLWSQIKGEAVTGHEIGTKLEAIAIEMMPWKLWKQKYPQTEVLSTNTGWNRDYASNAYDSYRKNHSLWFPVGASSNEFPNKEWVLGLELNGRFKAYAFSELKKSSEDRITDFFAGQKVEIRFDRGSETGSIYDETGKLIPHTRLYWFAWYAFHPNTEVYYN